MLVGRMFTSIPISSPASLETSARAKNSPLLVSVLRLSYEKPNPTWLSSAKNSMRLLLRDSVASFMLPLLTLPLRFSPALSISRVRSLT